MTTTKPETPTPDQYPFDHGHSPHRPTKPPGGLDDR